MNTPVAAEPPILRPMGIGDVVDRVFSLYRARPVLYLALSAIPYLLLVLVIGIGAGVFFAALFSARGRANVFSPTGPPPTLTQADFAALAGVIGAFVIFILLVIVASIVLLSAQTAALVEAAAAQYLGRPTTVGGAFRAGLGASLRVIAASITIAVALLAFWGVLAIVIFVPQRVEVAIVGSLAGVVASVYLIVSWLIVPVIATLEKHGPIMSLRRSWNLASGHRWRILGLFALLLILQFVISFLLSAVLVAAFFADQVARLIVQNVLNLVAGIAWAPVQWMAFTVFYYDLRVRKEALDLQLAAEALPRAD